MTEPFRIVQPLYDWEKDLDKDGDESGVISREDSRSGQALSVFVPDIEDDWNVW